MTLFKYIAVLLLLINPLKGFSQITIPTDSLIISDLSDLNSGLTITYKDKSLLAPNRRYKVPLEDNQESPYLLFSVNAGHSFSSPIIVKMDFVGILAKIYLENNKIVRREKIYPNTGAIAEAHFISNDTTYAIYYNKHGHTRAEYRKVNKQTLYSKNCSYNEKTDSIANCSIEDKINGLYESYEKGILIKQKRTQNLDKNIKSKEALYTKEGKIKKTTIEYINGKLKKIKKDGSYTIVEVTADGENVKSYNRKGKLLESYFAAYPSMN